MNDLFLAEAHRFLDWARDRGAELDGTDESVWFVQAALESMATDADEEPSIRRVKCLAYSVYLAELLADSCGDVRCVIDGEGVELREVAATREGESVQPVLSWVLSCLEDPGADNIVFKFAGALRDLGEPERARTMYTQLDRYREIQNR